MKLALSPGHHRYKRGAYSARFNKYEYDLAREVNELADRMLAGSGVTVYNVSLDELVDKVEQINLIEANLAVETHFNAAENSGSGFEVLYYPGSSAGKMLAQCLLQALNEYLPFKNRGIKERPEFYFLRATNCPAVIIEPLFIDNDSEMMFLEHYPRGLEVLALAVSQGIKAYTIVKKELP